MNEQLTTPFLPLGSILKLKDTNNDMLLYFIVARAIAQNDKGEIFSRYKVAPHPFGDVPAQEVFSINVEQIVKVVFEGFSDETDKVFLENLIEQMKNGKPNPVNSTPIHVSDYQEIEEVSNENDSEKIKIDPFYKFRE